MKTDLKMPVLKRHALTSVLYLLVTDTWSVSAVRKCDIDVTTLFPRDLDIITRPIKTYGPGRPNSPDDGRGAIKKTQAHSDKLISRSTNAIMADFC